MKIVNYLGSLILIYLSLSFTTGENYILTKNYKVTIHGTSNHDDWDETVGKVTGSGNITTHGDESFDLNALHLAMEVNSITSKSSVMTNKTFTALKADAHPEISFTLTSPIKMVKPSTAGTTVTANGNLEIAGVKKAVTLKAKVSKPKDGLLLFEGSESLKMTDYGVNPPTALFGMMVTGNEITLHFKTSFSKQ